MRWWREGVAAFNYDERPWNLAHPVQRPARLLLEWGWEVHTVSRGHAAERLDLDGAIVWVERSTGAAMRRMASLRAELVYVEASTYGMLFSPMGRRSWIRNPARAKRPGSRLLQRVGLRGFDSVSLTVPETMDDWRLSSGQSVELPYPVDVAWWGEPVSRDGWSWGERGRPEPRGPVLVCNAALIRRKRNPELIEALAPLLRANRDAVLVLVGNPSPEPEEVARIESARDAHGLAEQVLIAGQVSHAEIRALLAWASVSVINTAEETQCMAVYEALAAGVPAVIPRIPELTAQFPTLPAHANGRELLANVERVLGDPELRGTMIERSRDQLAWADVKRHDELWASNLERLLGREPRA